MFVRSSLRLKTGFIGTGCLLWLLLVVGHVWGIEEQKAMQLVAHIRPRVSLSLSQSRVVFIGTEDQKLIPAQAPVLVMVKGRTSTDQPMALTMRADTALESPTGHIPINQVSWFAQGMGFKNGALNLGGNQLVGHWTKSGGHQGQLDFVLKNNDNIVQGDYRAMIVFTLTAP